MLSNFNSFSSFWGDASSREINCRWWDSQTIQKVYFVMNMFFPLFFDRAIRSYFISSCLYYTPTIANKLIPKTIGNRKRDCAWGCAWGINTTWEICRSKSTNQFGERNERLPGFVLFDLQIFSGGVYSPSATSRTISFSISNSFWY